MSQEQETAMYDQPELDLDYEEPVNYDEELAEPKKRQRRTIDAELQGMHIKPKKRKRSKREKSLREIAATLPKPQYIMRDEILSNGHHAVATGLTAAGRFDQKVPELTEDIALQYELSLSLAQWKVVRKMVEDGLRLGYAYGEGDRG